jgi:hypothetical protein
MRDHEIQCALTTLKIMKDYMSKHGTTQEDGLRVLNTPEGYYNPTSFGICGIITGLHNIGIISLEQDICLSDFIKSYMDKRCDKLYESNWDKFVKNYEGMMNHVTGIWYMFEPGDWETRDKWIDDMIAELTELNV